MLGADAATAAAVAPVPTEVDEGQDSEYFQIVCEYIDELYLVKCHPQAGEEGVQQQLTSQQLRTIMTAVDKAVAAAVPPLPEEAPTTLGLLPNVVVQAVRAQLGAMQLREGGYDPLEMLEGEDSEVGNGGWV
jgi:hypothetical protein